MLRLQASGRLVQAPSNLVVEQPPFNNVLEVNQAFVKCGDWQVPCAEIQDAVLQRSWKHLVPLYNLLLIVGNEHYVFTFSGWRKLKETLPFHHSTCTEGPSLSGKIVIAALVFQIVMIFLHLLKKL